MQRNYSVSTHMAQQRRRPFCINGDPVRGAGGEEHPNASAAIARVQQRHSERNEFAKAKPAEELRRNPDASEAIARIRQRHRERNGFAEPQPTRELSWDYILALEEVITGANGMIDEMDSYTDLINQYKETEDKNLSDIELYKIKIMALQQRLSEAEDRIKSMLVAA